MNDSKNLAIGVLSITAVILLAAVILVTSGSQNPAQAVGMLDRGGDYIMVTAQFSENDEIVYITDAAAQVTNVYNYDTTRRELILWDQMDLKRVLGAARP